MLRNNYGDCKDKANALAVMCREIGVDAYKVLVNRNGTVDPEFPHWQFNHMIVYLPKYELWLDPTDNLAPFGQLALGDAGSYGMILAETPQFKLIEPAPAGRLLVSMTIQKEGISQIEIETSGFAIYAWEEILLKAPTPDLRRVRIAEFLNKILPTSELISYTTEPEVKLDLIYNGGMVQLPEMLTSAFVPPSRTNPIRLFDGGEAEFIYHITFKDESFIPQAWNESTEYCTASLELKDCRVEIIFTLNPISIITPEIYLEIRKTLYNLYREINLIQREQL